MIVKTPDEWFLGDTVRAFGLDIDEVHIAG
jgi:hypothetical protein